MHIKHQNLGFVGESLLIIQYTEAKPCLNFTKNSECSNQFFKVVQWLIWHANWNSDRIQLLISTSKLSLTSMSRHKISCLCVEDVCYCTQVCIHCSTSICHASTILSVNAPCSHVRWLSLVPIKSFLTLLNACICMSSLSHYTISVFILLWTMFWHLGTESATAERGVVVMSVMWNIDKQSWLAFI